MLSRMLCPSFNADLMFSCGKTTAPLTPGPPAAWDSVQVGETGGLCVASPPRGECEGDDEGGGHSTSQ